MKIHLVDGTYELFRSFCGALAVADGHPVGRAHLRWSQDEDVWYHSID